MSVVMQGLPSLPGASQPGMTTAGPHMQTASMNGISSTSLPDPDALGSRSLREIAPHPDPSMLEPQTDVFQDASYRGLKDIVPPRICGAVRSKDGRANISMTFPKSLDLFPSCSMNVWIKSEEVPYLARELFGVYIGTSHDTRYQALENGGRLFCPRNILQIEGSLEQDIKRILGSQILKAILGGPDRDIELNEGIVATRCVRMSVSGNPAEDALLGLRMDLTEGFRIRSKLYHEYPI